MTIKDVASLAGVSPMTVSRVINDSDRVSPDTERRVQQAIAELGYIPSRLARGLSARRTGTLAVIVPDVANPFFTMIVRAAEEVARRSSYRVILCDTRADLAVERDVIEELIAHRVEGIAIAPVSDRSKPHLARLARFGVPFVLIDRTVAGIECDAVVGDSVGGAQRLVEHLIGLGHRRIGLIVETDEVSSARERRRGYEAALTASGLPLDPALVEEGTPDPEGGYAAMSRLLSTGDRPAAVFAVNNLVALGAIEAVRSAGLEVPDDVGGTLGPLAALVTTAGSTALGEGLPPGPARLLLDLPVGLDGSASIVATKPFQLIRVTGFAYLPGLTPPDGPWLVPTGTLCGLPP